MVWEREKGPRPLGGAVGVRADAWGCRVESGPGGGMWGASAASGGVGGAADGSGQPARSGRSVSVTVVVASSPARR